MKPLILITNDDGIFSPGLKAAIKAVENLGEILVAAPKSQQTAMSRSLPKGQDIGIIEEVDLVVDGRTYHAFSVNGSPAQAVSYGILEIAKRKPALCLAGINYGENVGTGLFPSGTIGSLLEATTYGLPGLGMNVEASVEMQHSSKYGPLDWSSGIYFATYFAKLIIDEGLPPGISVINVNVPSSATPNTPIRVTRQSMQDYFVFKKPEKRDFSKGFRLEVEIKIDKSTLEKDSDIKALTEDRVVSVTPLVQNITSNVKWGKPEWQIFKS